MDISSDAVYVCMYMAKKKILCSWSHAEKKIRLVGRFKKKIVCVRVCREVQCSFLNNKLHRNRRHCNGTHACLSASFLFIGIYSLRVSLFCSNLDTVCNNIHVCVRMVVCNFKL